MNRVPSRQLEWVKFIILPGLVFFVVMGAIELFRLDIWLADNLFRWEGGAAGGWPLRHGFMEQIVLHDWGHKLVVVMALVLLFATVSAWKWRKLRPYRHGLLYLLLSFLLTVIVVGILKKYTHVNCPWDLLRYGGDQPYVPTFSALPDYVHPGRCFPGGHATGGYGWIGLYFFAKMYFPRWRWAGLAFALVMGAVFDWDQQLRGAHFLSHGLWTLAISWAIAALLYLTVFSPNGRSSNTKAPRNG
ncbi:hypothetical protein NFHSH190041_25250 [Shewanella sp. NFH-SH190041]|uniref:phosphatase PAP2 family protein n=1 Tax=Shewanella sp. NFH-SH190041 TaxID=2950245 RepID=UPI0021C41E71|nr:phosphatase PAP2 family protein [Shewanella sp. NFH-SH190041]BDM65073.1 hypothetical protein NFHSH190041_25250 [Shewanella sp. NFH-SH190041]